MGFLNNPFKGSRDVTAAVEPRRLSFASRITEADAKKIFGEAAISNEDDVWARMGVTLVDDDDLGIGDFRDIMRRDGQVRAAVRLKILARLSSGYNFIPGDDTPEAEEARDFIVDQFDEMDGTFGGFLRRAMLATAYGVTVHEKVYRYVEHGRWKGKIGLEALKWRRPESFKFIPDKYGNLVSVTQEQGGQHVEIPQASARLAIWCYEHEGDWKGQSELRAAYRWSKKKDLCDRLWNLFLDRYASPAPVAKYDKGATEDEKRTILAFIANLAKKRAALVPKEWELDMFESQRQGGDYEKSLLYADRQIARAFLIPSLLFDEGQSGAYALGKQHADNFLWVLDALGEDLAEDVVRDQIIRYLVGFNFRPGVALPIMEWSPWTEDDKTSLVEMFVKLIDAKVVHPDEKQIREAIGIEPKDEDLIIDPADEPGSGGGATGDSPVGEGGKDGGSGGPDDAQSDAQFAAPVKLSRHHRKFEARAIRERLEEIEGVAAGDMAAASAAMHAGLLKTIRKNKIVELRDYAAVDRLDLSNVGEIRRALETAIAFALHVGFESALDEVNRGLEAAGRPAVKISLDDRGAKNFEDFGFAYKDTLDDVVGAFGSKIPIQRELLREYTREAFTVTGVHRDRVLADAQGILRRAIRRGASYPEVQAELASLFGPLTATPGAVDAAVANPWRLHNIARTNMSEAFNSGRWALFNHPEVREFISAFEYTAVLDDRTTEVCNSWHGTILSRDDARVSTMLPPNHYQCRSTLIPIVTGETFELTPESAVPSIRPMQGFLV